MGMRGGRPLVAPLPGLRALRGAEEGRSERGAAGIHTKISLIAMAEYHTT